VKKLVGLIGLSISLSASASFDLAQINKTVLTDLDVYKMHEAALVDEKLGNAPRFAVERDVAINAFHNQWEKVEGNMVSRHRVVAHNAVSLNFAFKFHMTENSKVKIYSADFSQSIRDLTFEDNNIDQELWTPVIMANDVIIELVVPENEMNEVLFEIFQINQGFRTFSQKTLKAGSCNVDVACEASKGWEQEVSAVAVISTGGSTFCTGFMVNNTANDKTPFFMTANHCRINASNAASLVAYWNYQTSKCGGRRDGQKTQWSSGSQFLASSSKSDFTLVRLNQAPRASWQVSFAGWDRSGDDASSATAIHHPATDEKSISFEYDPTTVTMYLGEAVTTNGTHVRVTDWDMGTTEPGSSGSPLFDQNKRVIGQLHGGYASCSSRTSDWYGRFYTSWEGDGTASTRLKDWLDRAGTGRVFVDTL
jgi:lysyl endopeptidase